MLFCQFCSLRRQNNISSVGKIAIAICLAQSFLPVTEFHFKSEKGFAVELLVVRMEFYRRTFLTFRRWFPREPHKISHAKTGHLKFSCRKKMVSARYPQIV